MTGRCVRWTPEEDAMLREHFPRHGAGWGGWAEVLPGRSERAIVLRAFRLCIGVSPSVRSAHHRAAAMRREADRRTANGLQNGMPGKVPKKGSETRR